MSRTVALLLLFLCSLLCFVLAIANADDFNCNCDDYDDAGWFWSIQNILDIQRVSDFLIAAAYFSIPIELLYFVSLTKFPFKWVLVQFIAFIVLCGLTHLLNGWTYYGPPSFELELSLAVSKILTALVSCATAITLLPLIPLLLKWKVREVFLRQNVLELDQEVGLMKKQKEASRHVRMLTREIRKSLDKDTILYTTLVELSKTLELHNCLVWMPNEPTAMMNLTHEIKPAGNYTRWVPINDPYVVEIKKSRGVVILSSDSELSGVSSGSGCLVGPVAAIRMPLLQISDFKGGTPEFIDTRYAILVLVLPGGGSRKWGRHEAEIVEVVADQVAVALSHAAVLEESRLTREKLGDQNRILQNARRNAVMARAARDSFLKVMSHGMRRPLHSIVGLLSILQDPESKHKLIIDSIVKTGSVLSTLMDDIMEKPDGFPLETRPFGLHALIKEVSCVAKCLCMYKGFSFSVDLQRSLPDQVMGDENRTFQVILHMVGYLLDIYEGNGSVTFRVVSAIGDGSEISRILLNSAYVQFEIEISSEVHRPYRYRGIDVSETMCKSLVRMMQGKIWITSSSRDLPGKITLVLWFPFPPLRVRDYPLYPEQQQTLFEGLHVLLADDDDINRTVTKKQLEKLGCQVTAVSSGFECLSALGHIDGSFEILLLDLHMPDMDGFDVAMRIRKFRSRHWPLIIALTVSSEERVAANCLRSGMNGVVRKPAVFQTLADEIRRVLNRAGGV